MLDIYSERMINGKYIKDSYTAPTHDKVKNFLKRRLKDGDWYLEAEEAVYYGFADNVLNSRRYPSIDSLKT
jgi:ATP-dependent protease ClpP protease subunit